MKAPFKPFLSCIFLSLSLTAAHDNKLENWPDIRGPQGNYQVTSKSELPKEFSATTGENILWRFKLDQPGHSGIAVWADKVFFTCFRKLTKEDVSKNGVWVSETVGYCLDANTGKLLWTCELPGKRPNQVNGTFTDSTTPTPVTDGKHVWFVNAGGYMACHDMDGKRIWGKEFEVRTKHSAKQFQPFLHDGCIHYVMMRDKNDPQRRKQTAKAFDKNSKTGWAWMFVRRFDALTGEDKGVIKEGITVHSKGALATLNGGKVLLHAKGGGHSPPEKPYGIGLSKLTPFGELVWERPGLPFEGTHTIDAKHAYCFDKNSLIVLDLATGKTLKKVKISGAKFSYRKFDSKNKAYVDGEKLPTMRKLVTHRTNIAYGKYHYFLSYATGLLGRVNIESGKLEYLQVPLQVQYENGKKLLLYDKFEGNRVTGSGFTIEGDKRMLGHGFGHISAATPIIVNDKIYFSTILGTVYVIDAKAETFDENALLAVNDLGTAGECWTLAPFSCAQGKLFQHTMREIICIGH